MNDRKAKDQAIQGGAFKSSRGTGSSNAPFLGATFIIILLQIIIANPLFNFIRYTQTYSNTQDDVLTTFARGKLNRVNPLCISSHIDGLSPADVDKQTMLMQKAGIKWVRFDVNWGTIEQTKGVYTWTDYDYVVNAVTSKGMNVLALVTQYGIPSWERVDPINWQSPPNNLQDFQNFVQALTTHYKGKISLYEIGNEPNSAGFWPPSPSAQAYTQLLIAGYNGAKAADTTAKVISAGLANDGDEATTTNYIDTMYANGAQGHFEEHFV